MYGVGYNFSYEAYVKSSNLACFQVPDYKDVVKNPIDLQTIEDKLVSEVYSQAQQFIDDIALMFNNCDLYNKVGARAQMLKVKITEFITFQELVFNMVQLYH